MNAQDEKYVLRLGTEKPADPPVMVEIARSFSYKLNAGNYESRDFFASQKAQCRAEDAEWVSDGLYQFCKNEVLKAVKEYTKMRADQLERKGVQAA